MRSLTLFSLTGAMVLALTSLPLFFVFFPVAVSCVVASLLLIMFALPGLVAADTLPDSVNGRSVSLRSA